MSEIVVVAVIVLGVVVAVGVYFYFAPPVPRSPQGGGNPTTWSTSTAASTTSSTETSFTTQSPPASSSTTGCGVNCASGTPVIIQAMNTDGQVVKAPLTLDGAPVGTGLANESLQAGMHTLACGALAGYVAPQPLTFFTKGYDSPIPLFCTYYLEYEARINVQLNVHVQYCDEFTGKCGPDAAELVTLIGAVRGSALTNSTGAAVFVVPPNSGPYTATINYGIQYLSQSASISVGALGGNATMTVWFRVP
jgi:hypothetical protein